MDKKEKNDSGIFVKILNINKGLIEYENVKFIKIKSKHYNLIIMKDYLPIIGEIEGNVRIELLKDSVILKNIKGYFMNKKNQFNLFIKEEEEQDV